jgi:hypothetical protein
MTKFEQMLIVVLVVLLARLDPEAVMLLLRMVSV